MTGIPGFTFDGEHSNDFNIYLEQKKIEALPESRDYEQQIFGLPGQYDFETQHDRRMITLTLTMLSEISRERLIDNIRKFAALIDPTKGYKQLIFDDEPDKYYLAKYTSSGNGAQQPFVTYEQWMGHVQIGFKCNDPFAYGIFPKEPSFSVSANQEVDVLNNGTYDTPLQISVTSDSNLSDFEIDLNGELMRFTGTLPAGRVLKIDTGEMTYYMDQDNALQYWAGEFPNLKPGVNTLSANKDMNLGLSYRERWL